jgi:hypothetical protein
MLTTLSTHALRSSARRWERLSVLLAGVARGVEASARLDAHAAVEATIGRDHQGLVAFNEQLLALEARLDHELDVLTVERLALDLAAKIARVA